MEHSVSKCETVVRQGTAIQAQKLGHDYLVT